MYKVWKIEVEVLLISVFILFSLDIHSFIHFQSLLFLLFKVNLYKMELNLRCEWTRLELRMEWERFISIILIIFHYIGILLRRTIHIIWNIRRLRRIVDVRSCKASSSAFVIWFNRKRRVIKFETDENNYTHFHFVIRFHCYCWRFIFFLFSRIQCSNGKKFSVKLQFGNLFSLAELRLI